MTSTEWNMTSSGYKDRILLAYFDKLDDDKKDMVIDFVKELYKESDAHDSDGDLSESQHRQTGRGR